MLAHNVFFTLKDSSKESIDAMVAACEKYLKPHPGVEFFGAGSLVEDLDRPVNDRDFHVGLHVVFATREDHDRYQVADLHNQFIDENKDSWAAVRVFD
ncbi:MAG: Dabb family protein, partial [Planctomycetota bacterium]